MYADYSDYETEVINVSDCSKRNWSDEPLNEKKTGVDNSWVLCKTASHFWVLGLRRLFFFSTVGG